MADAETLQVVKTLCEQGGLGARRASRGLKFLRILELRMRLLERYTNALRRLNKLLNCGRFVELSDIFRDKNVVLYDEEMLSRVRSDIANERQRNDFKAGRVLESQNDLADAKNYLTVVRHAEEEQAAYRSDPKAYRGYLLRLLTNTPTLLRFGAIEQLYPNPGYNGEAGWLTDERFEVPYGVLERVRHSFAIRTLFEATYACALRRHCRHRKALGEPTSPSKVASDEMTKRHTIQMLLEVEATKMHATRIADQGGEERALRNIVKNLEKIWEILAQDDPTLGNVLDGPWNQTLRHLYSEVQLDIETQNMQRQPDSLGSGEEPWFEVDRDELSRLLGNPEVQRSLATQTVQAEDREALASAWRIAGLEDLRKFGARYEDSDILGSANGRRLVISNCFYAGAPRLVMFERLDGIYYLTWQRHLSVKRIIPILNAFFGPQAVGRLSEAEGVLLLSFNRDEAPGGYLNDELAPLYTVELARLPFKSIMDDVEYLKRFVQIEFRDTAEEAAEGRPRPVKLSCDSKLYNLMFDVTPVDGPAQISVAFKDGSLLDEILGIMEQSNPWPQEDSRLKKGFIDAVRIAAAERIATWC